MKGHGFACVRSAAGLPCLAGDNLQRGAQLGAVGAAAGGTGTGTGGQVQKGMGQVTVEQHRD
jgi:hypothetical protein